MKTTLKILLLILVLSLTSLAQTEKVNASYTQKGAELYKQGKYKEAISVLEQAVGQNKKDAEAWNMLGLAYLEKNDFKKSRKALGNAVKNSPQNPSYRINLAYANLLANKLNSAAGDAEQAIKLNPQNANAYYIRGAVNLRQGKLVSAIADADRAIQLKSNHTSAYILKSDGFLFGFSAEVSKGAKPSEKTDFLQKSIEALEACLKNCENGANQPVLQERLTTVRAFYNYFSRRKDETIGASTLPTPDDPSVTPLTILAKPRPNYTDSARQANVTGAVRLAILFSEDGKTKYILVMKPLSNGLTEEALAAARKIQFSSQMKDGKPVTVVKIVEYNFSLY